MENYGDIFNACIFNQHVNEEKNYIEKYKCTTKHLSNRKAKFYKTIHYQEGIEKLKANNYILLTGFSGSGKTQTSLAIANYFVDEEQYDCYKFSKISTWELKIAIDLIKEDEKNLIVFDDFLGSIDVIEDKSYLSSIDELLEELNYLECTKVILNSRKSILNNKQVENINDTLNADLNVIIDMNNWYGNENKANLFRQFCDRYELLDDIRESAVNDSAASEILAVIEHENFCPLIIDRALKECQTEKENGVEKLRYSKIIMKNLNETTQIWYKEVKDLDSYSKDYLLILYSLSRKNVQISSVEKCYYKYYSVTNKEMDINFKAMYKNLDSLIQRNGEYVELIHPSLVEYLTSIITEEERKNIIKGAVFIEQIEMLDDDKNTNIRCLMELDVNNLPKFFNYELIESKNIFDSSNILENLENIQSVFIKYINKLKIEKEELEACVLMCMENVLTLPAFFTFNNNDDIVEVLQLKYNFSSILQNKEFKTQLLDRSNYDNLSILLDIYEKKDANGYNYEEMDQLFKNQIDIIIDNLFNEYLIEDDQLILEIYSEFDEDEEICLENILDILLETVSEEEICENIKVDLSKIKVYNCNVDIVNIDFQSTCEYIESLLGI